MTGDVEIDFTVVGLLTVPGLFLYLLAAYRYLVIWRGTGSSIIIVMAASFVLLAEAMLAIATSRSWHLSWWEWHLLMLAAFVLIAVSANGQWHEERFKDMYIPSAARSREISVLFADLQGFTTFSEQHDESEVADMLNEYFGVVIPPLVSQFGGDIDRLIGDAIMVTFNRRGDQPDHAMRAARAALELQSRSQVVAHSHPSWPRFRVGVNSGTAALGVVGAKGGRTHTVIGDTVNVASRLEGRAPVGGVVVSEQTAAALSRAELERLGPVTVKGRAEPVEAFQLLSISSD
jgi:class 3 adenylate cyclase